MSITVIIPTFNRPKLLKRTLEFFAELKNPYEVWIMDGGDEASQKLNQITVEKCPYPAKHFSYPGSHWGMRLKWAFEKLESKYAVICADDDFLNVNALAEAREFLEKNPDYSAVMGNTQSLFYTHKSFLKRGLCLLNCLPYHFTCDFLNPVARVVSYDVVNLLGTSPIFYALKRTSLQKEMFKDVNADLKFVSIERINNTLTLYAGKLKYIKPLFYIRDFGNVPTDDEERKDREVYFPQVDVDYLSDLFKAYLVRDYGKEVAAANIDMMIMNPFNPKIGRSSTQTIDELIGHIKIKKLAQYVISIFSVKMWAKTFHLDLTVMKALKRTHLRNLDCD